MTVMPYAPTDHAVFHAPQTLADAAALLTEHGSRARLAGGASYLMLQASQGEPFPDRLISLHRVGGLDGVAEGSIGAMVTLRQLERTGAIGAQRAIVMAASTTAGPHVRSIGTVGGNLGCSDGGDLVPAMLALGAQVHLHDTEALPIERYVAQRPRHAIITGITHQLRAADGWSGASLKLSRRAMDWPLATVTAVVRRVGEEIVDARVAAGSVAPEPTLLPAAAAVLIGSCGEPEALDYAAEAATHRIELREDDETTRAYRQRITTALVRRTVALALRLGPDARPAAGEARA